jgi:hypothetical protein
MWKVLLSCSLLANAVFALLLARDPAWARSSTQLEPFAVVGSSATAAAPPAGQRAVPREDAAADAYFKSLLSLGLGAGEAKTLLRARLEREAAAGVTAPADTYWRSGAEARLEHSLALLGAEDRVRQTLLTILGPAARTDPAFVQLFRPLDPHLAFLDSGEQLTLRRTRLERQLKSATSRTRTATLSGAAETAEIDPGGGEPSFAEVLRPEALLEYELRESPLASRLRTAAEDLSEQQYRDAFAVLRSIDQGDGDLREHLNARAALERILGPRAFLRLWSTRDPAFGAVVRVAEQQGWSEQTALDAYALLVRHDEQLLEAIDVAAHDPAASAERIRERGADVERQLTELVGEDGAMSLIHARAAQSFLADTAGFSPRSAGSRR